MQLADLFQKPFRAADGAAAGGAAPAAGAGDGAGKPAAEPAKGADPGAGKGGGPAAEPAEKPDPRARRKQAYDKWQVDDKVRAEYEATLDAFEGNLDAAQQAEVVRAGFAALKNASGPGQRGPAGKTGGTAVPPRPAKEADDDDGGAAEDPVLKRLNVIEERFNKLLQIEEGRQTAGRVQQQRAAFIAEVKTALQAQPGVVDLADDAEELEALAAEAMGYAADTLGKHGNSRQKALAAWTERLVKREARARGLGVKEFIEQKVSARKAQSATGGGGRAPAETEAEMTPEDLASGAVLRRAADAAGVDL